MVRWLMLALAVVQSVVPWFVFPGDRSPLGGGGDAPIVPAGYAFSIWGLIYLANLGLAVWALRRDDPLLERIRLPMTAAYGLTSLWLVLARMQWVWATFACIVLLLAALLPAWLAVARARRDFGLRERLLVEVPVGLFAGWVSLATFANLAAALQETGWPGAGPLGACGMLAAAGLLAGFVLVRGGGGVPYAAAVVWGLAAVVVANVGSGFEAVAATAAGMALLVIVALALAETEALRALRAAAGARGR